MEPAKSILDRIGMETAARITGKSISRIYRWTYPADRGGTGGVIPHSDALKLLKYAQTKRLNIDASAFLQPPTAARRKAS